MPPGCCVGTMRRGFCPKETEYAPAGAGSPSQGLLPGPPPDRQAEKGQLWENEMAPEIEHEKTEFWCVWNKRGGNPKFVHATEESAIEEAKRLAVFRPGEKFIVMRATDKFRVATPNQESISLTPKRSILTLRQKERV